jgi:SUKH-4 immunity protein
MSSISPEEFKNRFLKNIPELPPDLPELRQRLSEFIQFPDSLVQGLNISQSDKSILLTSGLPKAASPFLSFGLSPDRILQPLGNAWGLPNSYNRFKMIGHNGSGDMICIDEANQGSIVYLNHDRNMQVVVINSNVTTLAECLCIFAEFMKCKDANACRREFGQADPAAMTSGAFWPSEIESAVQDL